MSTAFLSERYAASMVGVLECLDRVVITGSLHPLCYAKGMTSYLYQHEIRIFDYATFTQPHGETLRANAEGIAEEAGVHIRKSKAFRKEKRIQSILKERGRHPGLVHIFSAMESCSTYKPWHDKRTGKTYVKSSVGKCLHYYFYFIDEQLGLCYVRVPTWCPFRLQVCFNGHHWLANQLKQHTVAFECLDNAFISIKDIDLANQLAAQLDIDWLHTKLDQWATRYCPVATQLGLVYNWSIMQAEYATDLIFRDRECLQSFYPLLLESLIQAIKPEDIATFLGRTLHGNYQGEMGNRLQKRWLGTRIKHQMGPVTIKMYDKFGLVLRIETTVNDVTFFKQQRQVQHQDGSTSTQLAPMKKSI